MAERGGIVTLCPRTRFGRIVPYVVEAAGEKVEADYGVGGV